MASGYLTHSLSLRHTKTYRRLGWSLLIAALLAGTILAILSQTIVFSISTSSPHYGFFRLPLFLHTDKLQKGSWVLFTPEFVETKLELPKATIPFAKQIKGIAGDKITVSTDREVSVAGHNIGRAKTHTQLGREVTPIAEGVIPAGYLFVAGTSPDSRDSRYEEVGLIPISIIDAVLFPLPELPFLGITNERFVSLTRENEAIQLAIQKEGMP